MLTVFGGLPGTGKSTIARALAAKIGAVWLRIDGIEQALRDPIPTLMSVRSAMMSRASPPPDSSEAPATGPANWGSTSKDPLQKSILRPDAGVMVAKFGIFQFGILHMSNFGS